MIARRGSMANAAYYGRVVLAGEELGAENRKKQQQK